MSNVAKKRVDTKIYWWLGHVIDVLHMPFVIGLVLVGAARFTGELYVSIVVATVILQIGFLGCPCMALTGWLKRLHDPTFENHWSFTVWLYRNHGRWVAIAVFVFFIAIGLALRQFFV